MSRILLLENPHAVADDVFTASGHEVVRYKGALDEDELIEALDGIDVLGLRSKTNVTERVLRARPGLQAMGAFCIGTNQIDLVTAAQMGIPVFNAPYSNTRSVVELALAEVISLTRRLTPLNDALHAGVWDKTADGAHEVRGRTLGIVGYGNIGAQLSILAEAVGMKVVYYDVVEKLALGNARPMSSLEELLGEADVVSVHISGSAGTKAIFGDREFGLMKDGAVFINLSRGHFVDYDALHRALDSGKLSGAAADVYPEEPKKNGDPFEFPLRGYDNVILTPHIGGSTEEAQHDIGRFVAGKLTEYLRSASTDMCVNLPQLTLPTSGRGRHRVAYVHRNTPGVLALINQAFAEAGANIEGQILGTHGELGYVITDIASELPVEAIAALKEMEQTVRLRVVAV